MEFALGEGIIYIARGQHFWNPSLLHSNDIGFLNEPFLNEFYKSCLMFSVLNILDRNVVKYFALRLLLSLHRIVLLTGKLAGVEPLSPPVGASHELETAVQRDRIYRHPDTEHPGPVYGVVSLVLVPGGLLLCPWGGEGGQKLCGDLDDVSQWDF